MNWLLEVYNSGVVDSATNGSSRPAGIVNSFNIEMLVMFIITFLIGFISGFCIRHLIQIYKEAPDDRKKDDKKGE